MNPAWRSLQSFYRVLCSKDWFTEVLQKEFTDMKKSVFVLAVVLMAGLASGSVAAERGEAISLFDGESLAGWGSFYIGDAAQEDVWWVADGAIRTSGKPFGYLFTEDRYESFKLVIEWRWPEGVEPTNSGVLLRIASEPISFLTKCVEAQLAHGNVGDIWAFYGAAVEGADARFVTVQDHDALGNFKGVRKITNAERAPGEWNTYEITLDGEDLTLVLNGVVVNEATGIDVLAGPIGLQSEGGPIEFRKIEITPIEK